MNSELQDDRRLTWEEWQSKRQVLREQTRLVGPAVTRRKESSSDFRLRLTPVRLVTVFLQQIMVIPAILINHRCQFLHTTQNHLTGIAY